jgi:hypothetical protein
LQILHVRLHRRPVSLLRISVDAGQYAARPARLSSLSTRHNVVNRELFAARLLFAILAGHLVTLADIASAERSRLRRHHIALRQCDDFRASDAFAHRLNKRFITNRNRSGPIAAVLQLVVVRIDDPRGVISQHDQRTRKQPKSKGIQISLLARTLPLSDSMDA